jgi:2-amino-4-hydroxy-6-hydroxymethyldihydropteridine diphosphokinase
MRRRRFVLAPLAELAPDWTDPETGATVRELLRDLPARPRAKRLSARRRA